MPKAAAARPLQLSLFDNIDSQLESHLGEAMLLPIDPEDVGGELLGIVSKGLYTNPMDCIREYVQNAVDADASEATIKFTANSVSIHDNGLGMGWSDLLHARQFALSHKTLREDVGFRGIGIYSAYDLCQKLRISSKRAGEDRVHVLTFDFAGMRAAVEASKREGQQRISLIKLLSQYTWLTRDRTAARADQHFTQVLIEDISEVHIRQLSDRTRLRRYLLQNLPIDFAPDFEYRDVINERLRDHVPGYHAITIVLQSDDLDDETVARPAIPGLQAPTFDYIRTKRGDRQVAYYWACLNASRQRVDLNFAESPAKVAARSRRDGAADEVAKDASDAEQAPVGPQAEGFVYKVKGFTIGDRLRLRRFFTQDQLYRWYTGEIYVLDEAVIPNAERDDFEASHAKQALESAVSAAMQGLEEEAAKFQAKGAAEASMAKAKTELEEIGQLVEADRVKDPFEAFGRLKLTITSLKRHRQTPENKGLIARAQELQNKLRTVVEAPEDETKRRKRVARQEPPPRPAPVPTPLVPPAPIPSIVEVAVAVGLSTAEDGAVRLAAVVDEVLSESLSPSNHRSVAEEIERRLTTVSVEPGSALGA